MNDGYTYRCAWSDEDGEYVGSVDEFPSLSWLAPTQEDALGGIRRVTAEVVGDLRANGETVPLPSELRRIAYA